MAQRRFKDPIVSSGPTLVGSGNGTLTVDRLTHFTTAQTYQFTCIAKSPDTIFTVVGSLDGAVGLATVGVQFYDADLKIFATIQQGSTPFEVGDVFTLAVINGTDLNQDNIDDYDEEPQKNFGLGTKGAMSGDHSIRLVAAEQYARLFLQDMKYVAASPGAPGNAVQVRYNGPVPAVKASRTIQDLFYEAATGGVAGNSITVEYLNFIAPVRATALIQNVAYKAFTIGTPGNAVSVEYVSGGSLSVAVLGSAITVTVGPSTTALDIINAVNGDFAASALVIASIDPNAGFNGVIQTAPVAQTFLTGGVDVSGNAGFEVVQVTGSAITVRLETNVSTATQVRAALLASAPAMALVNVTISGSGANPQTAPVSPTSLTGGVNAYGNVGTEAASVTGSIVDVFFESGKSTATQILAGINASGPALALITPSIAGNGNRPQFRVGSNLFDLAGGLDKQYTLNKDELTDPPNFVEGNGDALMNDAEIQGDLDVAGHARHTGIQELADSGSTNRSGPAIENVQRMLNELLENFSVLFKTTDDTKVTWTKPQLFFDADIEIRFTDTGFKNTIAVAQSPITIADGSSLYVIVDRSQNSVRSPLVAATVPQIPEAIRIATRYGDDLILADNTLVRDGKSVRIGEGGEGGTIKVDMYDPVSTVLPTGPSATIDGVAVANNMFILFSNLVTGNNRVYKATGVGTSIVWITQSVWSNGLDPVLGDDVIAIRGVNFQQAHGFFDGTTFQFNDRVRYYNGFDYWEVSNLKQVSLTDNTTANVFAINYAGSENIFVDYSVIRAGKKRAGTLILTTDGITVAIVDSGAEQVPQLGIDFTSDISGATIRLRYTTSNTGAGATMKFVVRRWSDSAGGPAGLPSYSGTSGAPAPGSDTQILFNDGGATGAEPDFTWNKTSNILTMNGMQTSGLQSTVLLDAQASPAVALSYLAAQYPAMILEYSITRDGDTQVGRFLIANNGTDTGFNEDETYTNPIGIAFQAVINAGNVELQYISSSTGMDATMKYTFRRWA